MRSVTKLIAEFAYLCKFVSSVLLELREFTIHTMSPCEASSAGHERSRL
jgi:hypothetical protein